MRKRLPRRIIAVVVGWLTFSAALTYWITHDRHFIVRNISYHPAHPHESSLNKDTLVYCPICGEAMRLDSTPLSLRLDDGYRTHAHVRVEPHDALEWKREEE